MKFRELAKKYVKESFKLSSKIMAMKKKKKKGKHGDIDDDDDDEDPEPWMSLDDYKKVSGRGSK